MLNHLAIHLRSLLLAGLWLLATICHADQPAWQGAWSGTLGKSAITACLQQDGSSSYRYQRYQKDIPLVLKGNQWQETSNGKVAGIWTLDNPQGEVMEGSWHNPTTGVSLPIRLTQSVQTSVCAGPKDEQFLNGVGNSATTSTHVVVHSAADEFVQEKIHHQSSGIRFELVSGGDLTSLAASSDGKAILASNSACETVRSVNQGRDWTFVGGLRGRCVRHLFATPGKLMFAAVGLDSDGYNRGVLFRSSDNGEAWNKVTKFPRFAGMPHEMIAIPDGNLVAVGENGSIELSKDGGSSWIAAKLNWHSMPGSTALKGVVATSSGVLVSFGDGGAILRSTNGGTSWTEIQNDGIAYDGMTCMRALPNGTFLATGTGGDIVRSIDGGANWSVVKHVNASLYGLTETPNGVLIAFGDDGSDASTIVRSTDDGLTWSAIRIGKISKLRKGVYVPGIGLLVVGADGNVLRSEDAGRVWIPIKTGASALLDKMITVSGKDLLAAGESGTLVRSVDGASWDVLREGTTANLSSIVAGPDGALVAVGGQGAILRSIDHGHHWLVVDSHTTQDLSGIILAPDHSLLVWGRKGFIARSVTGGASWTAVKSGTKRELNSAAVGRDGVIVVVGEKGTVLRSTDSGVSWLQVKDQPALFRKSSGLELTRVDVTPDGEFIALALENGVVRSSDNGEHWHACHVNMLLPKGVVFSLQKSLFVAGADAIVQSVDFGETWSVVWKSADNQIRYQFNGMIQTDDGRLIAFGETGLDHAHDSDNGVIVTSIDSGNHWAKVAEPDGALNMLLTLSRNSFVVVGNGGTMLRSTDGGATWNALVSGTNSNLNSVVAEPDGTIVAVGDDGVIIRGGAFPSK